MMLNTSPSPVFVVEWRSISSVIPWDKNPRKNALAIPKVAASIRRFGFVAPIVVWGSKGRIVAGHTRLAALQSILAAEPGYIPKGAPATGVVPVALVEFESDDEAATYTIADNRLTSEAEWDLPALAGIVQGLKLDPDLLNLTGFNAPELEPLLRFGAFVLPELEDSPSSDDAPSEGGGSPATPGEHTVVFTDEQYKALMVAVERWRRGRQKAPGQSLAATIVDLVVKRED